MSFRIEFAKEAVLRKAVRAGWDPELSGIDFPSAAWPQTPLASQWRADVLLRRKEKGRIRTVVVEIQLSPQPLSEYISRTRRYMDSGIDEILWLIGHEIPCDLASSGEIPFLKISTLDADAGVFEFARHNPGGDDSARLNIDQIVERLLTLRIPSELRDGRRADLSKSENPANRVKCATPGCSIHACKASFEDGGHPTCV